MYFIKFNHNYMMHELMQSCFSSKSANWMRLLYLEDRKWKLDQINSQIDERNAILKYNVTKNAQIRLFSCCK